MRYQRSLEICIQYTSNTLSGSPKWAHEVSSIESLRRVAGLSQSELGRLMGEAADVEEYSRQAINNWEKGTIPMCDRARKIFETFIRAHVAEGVGVSLVWKSRNRFRVKLVKMCECGKMLAWKDGRVRKCRLCRR